MIAFLEFVYMSWLIAFFSIFHVGFSNEKGMKGTPVENFSCVVRSYTFKNPTMNCTWNPSKNAPQDAQYFLYLTYKSWKEENKCSHSQSMKLGSHAGGNRKEEYECPHYLNNKFGRHVGCHFPNVTGDKYPVCIRVNGSSIESSIQPNVQSFRLHEEEWLRPPQNITVDCKSPLYCTVQWRHPSSVRKVSSGCFKFQIKDELRNTTPKELENTYAYNFTQPAKYVLRIRTGGSFCPISRNFGEWSHPIKFGSDSDPVPIKLLVFAVLVITLIIVLLVLICKRYHIWEKLTGPVPQPKGIMWQCEKTMEKWVTKVPTAGESITVVEEMNAICKKI